jgi:hypothetical protein
VRIVAELSGNGYKINRIIITVPLRAGAIYLVAKDRPVVSSLQTQGRTRWTMAIVVVMLSSSPVAIGALRRMPVLAPGVRITIGGLWIPVSVRVFAVNLCKSS